MKLTDLLDQIDRLDQQATPGPWTTGENDETGLKYFGTGYCDCCTPPIPSAGIILGETGRAEAEFIALARDALPQLAEALRAVLDVLDDYTMPGKLHDPTGIAGAELETLEQYIREAITETLGTDDE